MTDSREGFAEYNGLTAERLAALQSKTINPKMAEVKALSAALATCQPKAQFIMGGRGNGKSMIAKMLTDQAVDSFDKLMNKTINGRK